MINYNSIKSKFKAKFDDILFSNSSFRNLLYEIFIFDSAYVVGGFLRDIINNNNSRDLDILVDISHSKLLNLVESSKIKFIVNRHNGIKLIFESLQVDIWSIDNNWAFKNDLVKLNEDDKLSSIAKGCFYNYDALVINIHNHNLNIQYYVDFLEKKQLDILQKKSIYKNLNPTIEANILRAFYLRKNLNITYSINTNNYLLEKVDYLFSKNQNLIETLLSTKRKYPKYETSLTISDLALYLKELSERNDNSVQLEINL